jgi:hypothetical protein
LQRNSRRTHAFIGLMFAAGIAGAVWAGVHGHALHPTHALALLVFAAITARMKVKLPGVDGNMSVNMPFLLMAVVSLSAAETIAIACVSTVVQCWPKRGSQFKPEQMLFNVSMMAFATSVASIMWNAGWFGKSVWTSEPLMLASATATFFLGQTAPVAGIITLTEGAAMRRIWISIAQLTFPYFVVSAGMTSMVDVMSQHIGWHWALAIFPVMYAIHRSYRVYFKQSAETLPSKPLTRSAKAGA